LVQDNDQLCTVDELRYDHCVNVSDFDFALPPELIAQNPPVERGSSRLLHLNPHSGAIHHGVVDDLPAWLRSGDVLVVNDTLVFPARLLGARLPGGGAVECLLVSRIMAGERPDSATWATWEALMHPGQRLREGSRVVFEGRGVIIHGEVLARQFHGRRLIRLWTDDASSVRDLDRAVDAIGHVPLPPYIKRGDSAADRDRYQTVFAAHRGSVAAPTAGLHFTEALIAKIRSAGIEVARLTLHVGYGTFQPVRVERVEDHRLDAERYDVPVDTAALVNQAVRDGRRVIAVGTTTTRTLEAVALANDGLIAAGSGETDLFIAPGFRFRVVSGLFTNFHRPRSSLLMLVAALGGRDRVLRAYQTAIAERYRFYSYGDAMLVL
jgi:S-adenosylmethionine:tRNA ribosyltransferase-isomerase